jgi:aspartate oxidase
MTDSAVHTDVLVVGSGVAGLSVAARSTDRRGRSRRGATGSSTARRGGIR